MHNSIHSIHIPSLEYLRQAKHPSMHKTDTLNYFVLTEGEIWSLSEGKDVLLKAGDVMIQRGCMHGWRNDSDKRAVLAAILIDANPA
jgi:quercetin dioxygenase-like cupin family protein